MIFDLLFFRLSALKSPAYLAAMAGRLAVRTDAYVFRLASRKNSGVKLSQILPWWTINKLIRTSPILTHLPK